MRNFLVRLVGSYLNSISYLSKSYAAEQALLLFSKPRKGQISDIQSQFLETAINENFQYETFQIRTYRWQGNGQTILLVHGWESNSARWKPLINHLKNYNYNIVAVDAPAHGNSGSPYFNALLYAEFINEVAKKMQPTSIIGHSVGGMASVFFQNKYRLTSIKKMVLLGSPSDFKDVLKRYTDMLGYNNRISEHLNHIIKERYGAIPEAFSTARFVETLSSQGLIIHDQDVPVIPFSDAVKINSHFKNSTLITTKGLGHSLNHKKVTLHISEFIEN
jgi:predicted alpha/beta hydrolase family esterase